MTDQSRCDRTLVGAIARDSESRVLLVNKSVEPFGWSCPSGHCDGKSYASACFKHFEEATGLRVVGTPRSIGLKRPIRNNICERENSEWHEWMIFEVDWAGQLKTDSEKTRWFSVEEIDRLIKRMEWYLQAIYENCHSRANVAEIIDQEWRTNPGLEPVWYEFFKELKII